MGRSRTQSAIYNSTVSITIQILKIIVSFLNRTFFIYFLGITLLGISGLFTSILSVLSLAELGMSTAMAVSLYRPLAEKNTFKIKAYMQLFRKIYIKISGSIFILGVIVSIFLPYFMKDTVVTREIYYIYFLFLGNTVISYLYTFKRILLDADQKRYINVTIDFVVFLLGSICQWIVLWIVKSFIAYLILSILMTLLSNILISRKVDKIYIYLKEEERAQINTAEEQKLFKNVKGTLISKIAETLVFSTDNILMSAFISVNIVGMYANYSMIVKNIQTIIAQLISSLSGSLGNLIYSGGSRERVESILKKYQYVVFMITLFSTSGILLFSNILISLWLGNDYLFTIDIVFCICLSFFITIYRIPFLTFINSYGLFWEQRIKNIVEAILNLLFSLGLLLYTDLGILAVLIGTVLSSILTVFWFEPYSVYKFGLKMDPKRAIKNIVIHYLYTIIILVCLYFIMTKVLVYYSIFKQFIYSTIIIVIIIVVTIILFSRSSEYIYIKNLVYKYINRHKTTLQ
ncbi:MAG: lipopolysaccharide biosynthesis protein [Gemella haemolysans]|uniref:lipopolysaccharide biosynthesis protein n=1 Tax=Gemella haemolysans TaxID=1379 RepID=UPI003F9F9CA9